MHLHMNPVVQKPEQHSEAYAYVVIRPRKSQGDKYNPQRARQERNKVPVKFTRRIPIGVATGRILGILLVVAAYVHLKIVPRPALMKTQVAKINYEALYIEYRRDGDCQVE